ncbi:hypothetical protein PJ311_14710 [Bacillus sp. CLL-7-23]|uniref:Uncharacterized protein n=1 Tax=Bacillus changyiensis TaxID=3004103 RepID=A0ABT4X6A3_9BACI|nr:hypothetical protein [Bacillus changyiensis]MDA7027828.1 hypothetical protein [Bacillus changyiensis]
MIFTDIDINIDTSQLYGTQKKFVKMLNNAKITVDVRGNEETKQSEVVFRGKYTYVSFSKDFNLPIYLDENKHVGYLKLDDLLENFGMFIGTNSRNLESVKDKYLEFPLEERNHLSSQKTAELKRTLLKSIRNIANDFPQDKFKEGNLTDKEKQQGTAQKVTLSLNDKDSKGTLIKIAEDIGKAIDKPFSDSDLNNMKEDLKDITFKKMNFTTKIDDKGILKNLTTDLLVNIDNQSDIGFKFSTTFHSTNGNVQFKHKPKADQIITEEQLQSLLLEDNQQELEDVLNSL